MGRKKEEKERWWLDEVTLQEQRQQPEGLHSRDRGTMQQQDGTLTWHHHTLPAVFLFHHPP